MITHFWDVYNDSRKPGVTWLLGNGATVYGCAERGKLPEKTNPCNAPVVIRGIDPLDRLKKKDFGEWRPVSEWLQQKGE